MRAFLDFLAERRWAGVGLAVAVELCALGGLGFASSSTVAGISGVVVAAIGGTVAVVYGVADGVGVALVGAAVFVLIEGSEPGALSALVVWPAVVAAAGLFARRVERHRAALHALVEAHEQERQALAVALHDESAQSLTAALLALRASGGGDTARDLIAGTIESLRALAVDLSPKALEDHGLDSALARLVDTVRERTTVDIRFSGEWHRRLTDEAERALFRLSQSALADAIERGARTIDVALRPEGDAVVLLVAEEGSEDAPGTSAPPEPAAQVVRLLRGRVSLRRVERGFVLRAALPTASYVRRP